MQLYADINNLLFIHNDVSTDGCFYCDNCNECDIYYACYIAYDIEFNDKYKRNQNIEHFLGVLLKHIGKKV